MAIMASPPRPTPPTSNTRQYAIADTGLIDARRPQIPEPGNALVRSLVRFRVWQDPVLAARSKKD